MATECREKNKRVNRHKLAVVEVYAIMGVLVLIGIFIGRATADKTIVTKTVTVGVPVLATSLPEAMEDDVTYFDVPLSRSLQRYIHEVCADGDVPVALVMAMIDHESQFDAEAVSSTGDYGLMQINEINHETLAEKYRTGDMLNPYQNVFCGIKMIGSYLETYGDCGKALMAYNMGNYGAKKAWENGITSTSYSETIIKLMSEYEQEVEDNARSADS